MGPRLWWLSVLEVTRSLLRGADKEAPQGGVDRSALFNSAASSPFENSFLTGWLAAMKLCAPFSEVWQLCYRMICELSLTLAEIAAPRSLLVLL